MANITNQMAFFEACEIGDIMTARDLIRDVDQSSLKDWRTPEAKTCLHGAVLAGNPDFLRELVAKIHAELPELIKKADNQGNTALHLALRNDREELVKDRVDLMKQMAELDVNLCDCANNEGETPLKLAVCLGFEEAVVFLITRTSNALHYIVELNQVKLIGNLIKRKVDLSELINQPYQPATNSPDQENYSTNPSDNNDNRSTNSQHVQPNVSGDGGDRPSQSAARRKKKGEDKKPTNSTDRDTQDYQPIVRQGDTPLHIAARNKYENMVNLLLKVPGANKLARNSEDKTPFEIAREVTEYYESFRIIRDLAYHRMQPKPFMYCTPKASITKNNNARLFIKKAYEERRNSELVVAALLATLTCAAAFTVPGGFDSDNDCTRCWRLRLRSSLG
ncbi:protein VAPYRIN-like isoform X2 [Cryptomeria japonica]|uniref:protein VAPYRIN-like isoform X2 n=1 Tax=Cryptomeria japonica TaxID=3369 RepID=UPI0025ACB9A5|nr:protein VAPYRIN-like isoform X2 [Cryptomeria japonica]